MATADGTEMASVAWQARATPHFAVHFHPGGFAAGQVEPIVRRLSRLRAAKQPTARSPVSQVVDRKLRCTRSSASLA